MKSLYLVRHGRAAGETPGGNDMDRDLTRSGREAVKATAAFLAEQQIIPDVIICSPARRARRSATILAKGLGVKKKAIREVEAVYSGSDADNPLWSVLRGLGDDAETVVLVGHNPYLSDLANRLYRSFEGEIPPAGVIGFDIRNRNWEKVGPGRGTMRFLEFPEMERASRRKTRAALARFLAAEVRTALDGINPAVAARMDDADLEKAMAPVAKGFVREIRRMGGTAQAGAGDAVLVTLPPTEKA